MKNLLKPILVRDIQVFMGFANFYWHFISSFSKIIILITSMLKTTRLFEKLALKAFRANNNEIVEGSSGRVDKTVVDLFKSKNQKSKKLTHMPNIGATEKPNFLTPNVKKTFNHFRLVFIKASIFRHFDLESHIWIETDASSYAVSGMLSQLNLNSNAPRNDSNKSDFGQWHLVAYFFRKMIFAKT